MQAKDTVPTLWLAESGQRIGTYNGHLGTVWDLDPSWCVQAMGAEWGCDRALERQRCWLKGVARIMSLNPRGTCVKSFGPS